MCRISILLRTIVLLGTVSLSAAVYTILAPNAIRAGTTVHVTAVSRGNAVGGRSTELVISIYKAVNQDGTATKDSNENKVSAKIILTASKLVVAKLQIPPKWTQGQYVLRVTGKGPLCGDGCDRYASINFNEKHSSQFIQTDKSIYQPGQNVKYRILLVNSDLLALTDYPIRVTITDPQNNVISQLNVTTSTYGIYENYLQLSEQPTMGSWSIVAETPSESTSVNFKVLEYVPTRFDVTVSPPPFVTRSQDSFVVTVEAQYTFNEGVKGTLTIKASDTQCTYSWSKCEPTKIQRTPIDGKAKITIKMGDLQLQKNVYSITVLAIVTEEATGIAKNQSVSIQVYDVSETLVINQPSSITPGIPHTVTIKLQTQDGRPIAITGNGARDIQVTYNFGIGASVEKKLTLNEKGEASFTVVAIRDATAFSVTATYKSLTAYGSASVASSLSDKYMTVSLISRNLPTVGATLTFGVTSSFQLDSSLVFEVVGRGDIQQAGQFQLTHKSGKGMSGKFSFVATKAMSPHVKVLVYYVSSCGEIVGNALDLDIGGALTTPLEITTSNDKVEPGDVIKLNIRSSINALVAFSAVDRSILLMSTPNDITEGLVYNDLQQYDIGNTISYGIYSAGKFRRPDYGSLDQIFSYCGLVLLTDGLYSSHQQGRCPIFFGRAHTAVMEKAMPLPAGPRSPATAPRLRSNFPESFLWDLVETNSKGLASINYTVPDTITTWVINGFAVSHKTGLGLMEPSKNLTVFRSFFIVLNLPYSVVREEIVSIQVLVFNYLTNVESVKATVSLTLSDQFEVVDQTSTDTTEGKPAGTISQTITIRSNDVGTLSFRIKPTKAGEMDVVVTAIATYANDAIKKQLLVKAEGTTEYRNKATLIDLRKVNTFSISVPIDVPSNVIPGSTYINVVVIGDFMASIYSNINNLIRLPSGCGEQNLINFVPDIVILNYLKKRKLLSSEMENRLIGYLQTGYQTELTFKRYDGSYSAFGNSDNVGSTWMTAFVVKAFERAESSIYVDPNVIDQAKQFLVNQQDKDTGEYIEHGKVLHKALQGGSNTGAAITAFVVIAFLEIKDDHNAKYQNSINSAVTFLENRLTSITSIYELTIVTYALILSNSPLRNEAFQWLQSNSTNDGDLIYWHNVVPPTTDDNEPTPSYDVEATGYAVLCYSLQGQVNEALPAIRWLVTQRNRMGGYYSTQDTVIAVQALATVAYNFASTNNRIQVTVSYPVNQQVTFQLTDSNRIVVNTNDIPSSVKRVTISATGTGTAYAQVSWNYNVPSLQQPNPSFSLTPTITPKSDHGYVLTVCTSFLKNDTTNMVLLEVRTLSGFQIDRDALPTIGSKQPVQRIEFYNSDTLAVVYFYSIPITPNEVCVTFETFLTCTVEELQPAAVRIYDYYVPTKFAYNSYALDGAVSAPEEEKPPINKPVLTTGSYYERPADETNIETPTEEADINTPVESHKLPSPELLTAAGSIRDDLIQKDPETVEQISTYASPILSDDGGGQAGGRAPINVAPSPDTLSYVPPTKEYVPDTIQAPGSDYY